MRIIPVIDLIGGEVVRARMGDRDAYRPIITPLSPTSDPVDVAAGLLELGDFNDLYIADLDSIRRRGDNRAVLKKLRAKFPQVRLWVDDGAADAESLEAILDGDLGMPVLGSESQERLDLVAKWANSDRVAVSLDFRGDEFQGPKEILAAPQFWPRRVIVMTLARVGADAGPDLEKLTAIRVAAGKREIYAAGGVRDGGDLRALKASGAAGVLVASALHDGRLSRAELAGLGASG